MGSTGPVRFRLSMPHVRPVIALNRRPAGFTETQASIGASAARPPSLRFRAAASRVGAFAAVWLRGLYMRYHDIHMSHVSREWLTEHDLASGRHTRS
jgi:hypothetical protein